MPGARAEICLVWCAAALACLGTAAESAFISPSPIRLRPPASLRSAPPIFGPPLHQRKTRGLGLDMVWRRSTQASYDAKKVFPLLTGETLIIGKDGWFISSDTSESVGNQYGDQAVPLEIDLGYTNEEGEVTEMGNQQVAWILYRDGDVIRTVTEDEIDAVDPLVGGSGTGQLGVAALEALSGLIEVFSFTGSRDADAGMGYRLVDKLLG
eukprot:CAMPEP_0172053524 /NCGR_PEP_ID=MMETSP1043-20130122/4260_1 /TAXON_ID=464988 /ORGANISM="Hemiselmis andersenii, Strain CCMP441" /LENGTH=209 /DNA_ID=CAMNT_0012712795 /DNA_START=42 /DNA_END=667 /DNA_ORIENTATION=+